jgi:hypothetical protein
MQTIAEVPDDAILVTDSQDVAALKANLRPMLARFHGDVLGPGGQFDFDGFFVCQADGEYTGVWGFHGSPVPMLSAPAYPIPIDPFPCVGAACRLAVTA